MTFDKIISLLKKNNFTFKHSTIVDSTMDEIKKNLNIGNVCLISDCQSKGFGRRGSKWYSPKGNVYLSFLIKYDLDLKDHFVFNALMTVSFCEVLEDLVKIYPNIKWPNDILLNYKKISGTISEILYKKNEKYIVLGIGINVISSPNINKYPTTCINNFNSLIDRDSVIHNFIEKFFINYEFILSKSFHRIINKFRKRLILLGKSINLQLDNDTQINGIFKDINKDGSIMIEYKGSTKNIYSARIVNEY